MANDPRRPMVISPLWLQGAILTFLFGFAVLGYLALRVYQDHAPVPGKVVSETGQIIFTGCPLKASCTPHDEGRRLYRPLAAWAETDIGRFHRRLSLLMIGVGAVFSLGGLARWMGQPGTGLLLLSLAISLACVARDLRAAWAGPDLD